MTSACWACPYLPEPRPRNCCDWSCTWARFIGGIDPDGWGGVRWNKQTFFTQKSCQKFIKCFTFFSKFSANIWVSLATSTKFREIWPPLWQQIQQKSGKILRNVGQMFISKQFSKLLTHILRFEDGPRECVVSISARAFATEDLLATFGFETAETEPSIVLPKQSKRYPPPPVINLSLRTVDPRSTPYYPVARPGIFRFYKGHGRPFSAGSGTRRDFNYYCSMFCYLYDVSN